MGGKNANKHQDKKIKNANGTIGKTAVVGMLSKDEKESSASGRLFALVTGCWDGF